jgi:hypothetical protein
VGERSPGSDLGRPTIDWEAAFLYYASCPPQRRSYAAVATRFGVSRRTVERHGRQERWRERAAAIEAEGAREAEQRLGRARAVQLSDFHRLIEASCVAYAQQLASGRVRVTASDLVGLIRISLQLHGEPTARVEVLSSSPEWTSLRTRILEILEAYPEAQRALADALSVNADE